MPDIKRSKTRNLHAPPPIFAVSLGFGLAYLVTLAVFALAFARPPAIGWAGFAIVAAVVLAVMIGIAQFLTRSSR